MYSADENRYNKIPIRRAGNTGFQLPAISFGMWHGFGDTANYAATRTILLHAFDAGIFSFDLAANYGPGSGAAEKLFGEVYASDLKPYRDELVISTKAGYHMWPGPYGEMSSRKTLVASLDRSLINMGLDYVDIYYSHRPDPNTAPEETAQALDHVVRQGKALYAGISNYDAKQTAAMVKVFRELKTPFVINQVSYNMLNRSVEEDGLLTELRNDNVGMMAYGPLAEGLLTDKYLTGVPQDFPLHFTSKYLLDGGTEALTKKINELNQIAEGRNQTLSQMAMAWLLHDPVVTSVITGTTNPDHLDDNLKALDNLNFTQDELDAIDKIVQG
ncbi:aldo/keto reductase [Levilactobacillus bambusae]|uniref:Aldo/keto reductase n=1 Tax=Levilactobacillus bambusae TaxID=2024736 RepID=A0A2V1N096_9LACO|nr:aldo/keto reductase [Levilactobacillus bambusae]PWG00657.1 aldo/keto reductase [Levilactobacillus bambusae]